LNQVCPQKWLDFAGFLIHIYPVHTQIINRWGRLNSAM